MKQILDKLRYREARINNSTYSDADNINEVKEFWKNIFQNEMKYQDYFHDVYSVENLSTVEKEIFHSYLFDNKNMNEILREWNNERKKLKAKTSIYNDRCQSYQLKM
ncbi:hypothetical protein [Lactobacillus gasseri]|uniref:hypothetical protein n=1 Tax=Lactobacillus gasseri TaxID=1596 RepID=UPI003BA2F496